MEVSNLRVEQSSMVTNSKLKGSESGSDPPGTMDSFQDGGQQNILERASGEFSSSLSTQNMDSPHVNPDINNYNPGGGEPSMVSQSYSKIPNDHMASGQMSGFNNTGTGQFGRGSFAMNDQHGGMPNAGSGDFSQHTSQILPYGSQTMRPGYTPSSRTSSAANRPSIGSGPLGVMPQNYGPGQPRFPLSGPNIQQQGGPTPTLNQLLQNNQSQRYPGSYGDYNTSLAHPKAGQGQDMGANEPFSPPQGWGGQQRPGVGPYPPQGPANPSFRNQMYNDRRPAGMNYPPGQGGHQFGGQTQFSPNSQRLPSQHLPGRPGQGIPGQYSGGPNNQMGNFNNQSSNHYMPQHPSQSGSQQSVQHQSHLQNFLQQSSPHQQQPPGTPQSQHSPGQRSQPTPPQPSPGPPLSSPQQRGETNGPEHLKEQTSQLGAMLSSPEAQNASDSQHSLSQDSSCSQQSLEDNGSSGKGNGSGIDPRNSTDTPTSRSTPTPSSTPGPQHSGLSSLRPTPSPAGSTGSRSNTPHSTGGQEIFMICQTDRFGPYYLR